MSSDDDRSENKAVPLQDLVNQINSGRIDLNKKNGTLLFLNLGLTSYLAWQSVKVFGDLGKKGVRYINRVLPFPSINKVLAPNSAAWLNAGLNIYFPMFVLLDAIRGWKHLQLRKELGVAESNGAVATRVAIMAGTGIISSIPLAFLADKNPISLAFAQFLYLYASQQAPGAKALKKAFVAIPGFFRDIWHYLKQVKEKCCNRNAALRLPLYRSVEKNKRDIVLGNLNRLLQDPHLIEQCFDEGNFNEKKYITRLKGSNLDTGFYDPLATDELLKGWKAGLIRPFFHFNSHAIFWAATGVSFAGYFLNTREDLAELGKVGGVIAWPTTVASIGIFFSLGLNVAKITVDMAWDMIESAFAGCKRKKAPQGLITDNLNADIHRNMGEAKDHKASSTSKLTTAPTSSSSMSSSTLPTEGNLRIPRKRSDWRSKSLGYLNLFIIFILVYLGAQSSSATLEINGEYGVDSLGSIIAAMIATGIFNMFGALDPVQEGTAKLTRIALFNQEERDQLGRAQQLKDTIEALPSSVALTFGATEDDIV